MSTQMTEADWEVALKVFRLCLPRPGGEGEGRPPVSHGLRYPLHAGDVPGRPDLVLPKYRAVVFVNGCFWHRYKGCRYATIPATRPEFWKRKLAANVERDKEVRHQLASIGWRVAIVWECALRKPGLAPATAESIADWLNSEEALFDLGAVDD